MSQDKQLPEALSAVYVVHAKKGYEKQGAHVEKLFGNLGLPFEFVSDGDVDQFTDALLAEYFVSDIFDTMRKGSVSLTLNHLMCLVKMVKKEQPLALIFEDDPFVLGDFMSSLAKVVAESQLLPPGFIISIENSGFKFPPRRSLVSNRILYPAKATRCAGAYLIDLEGAKRALARIESHKCGIIIDWWYNELLNNGILQMYWAHPPLIEQGSHNGLLSSTISTRKSSFMRRIAWQSQKYYKTFRWWLRYYLPSV
jgi:glycosyl transferase family 25